MADRLNIDGFRTQRGESIDVQLAHRTPGTCNADGDNAVVVTTSYAVQDNSEKAHRPTGD